MKTAWRKSNEFQGTRAEPRGSARAVQFVEITPFDILGEAWFILCSEDNWIMTNTQSPYEEGRPVI